MQHASTILSEVNDLETDTRPICRIKEHAQVAQMLFREDIQYHLRQSMAAILKTNNKKVLKDPSNLENYPQVATTNTVSPGLEGSFYTAGALTIQMEQLLTIHR